MTRFTTRYVITITPAVFLALALGGVALGAPPAKKKPARPQLNAAQRACVRRAAGVEQRALKKITPLLKKLGLGKYKSIYKKTVKAAKRSGLDEAKLLVLAHDLHASKLCVASTAPKIVDASKVGWQAEAVLALLGHLGTRRAYPLLTRLAVRWSYKAESAREKILAAEARAAIAKSRCRVPSPVQIARSRAALGRFGRVENAMGKPRLLALTRKQRSDLAYFLAAMGKALPAVGNSDPVQWVPRFARKKRKKIPAVLKRTREAIYARMKTAELAGNLEAMQQEGLAYIKTLGYPWGIDGLREHVWSWGGARYSYVMRDLAVAAEMLGRVELAAELYRRANPGGGGCGSSTASRWAEQVRGAIRTAERKGRCNEVVAERLLELERGISYGTKRLAKAGFDVPRLFRGALVTLDRDLKKTVLLAASRRSSPRLAQAFLARAKKHGAEAWEQRVYALEGLADSLGKAALPALLKIAQQASLAARRRALQAIAKVARRPYTDPCNPAPVRRFGMSGGSGWRRSIRKAGRSCKTSLRPKDVKRLLRAVLPLTRHAKPVLRQHAAMVLGALAVPAVRPTLARLAKDPYKNPNSCRIQKAKKPGGKERCIPIADVAEAAAEGLKRLAEFEKDAKEQARAKKTTGYRRTSTYNF